MKRIPCLVAIILFGVISSCTSVSDKLEISAADNGGLRIDRMAVSYDSGDDPLIAKVADLFAGDIEMVTGSRPDGQSDGRIIIGTAAGSKEIAELAKAGKIDIGAIADKPETFIISCVGNDLVIAGSDKRGAAYGAFTISQKMGVSPFYWFSDVPVPHMDAIYVDASYVSKEPSVRFRGFFINDEDWSLTPWAALNYEKELGDIGPKTYEKVCELLLRFKGNMLAPAMHACTGPFYSHPESAAVADSYGIMITTSHCEPLLFNNASTLEWDPAVDGEWNYMTNKDVIKAKLDARVAFASAYDNIYTVAMRGLHDAGMVGEMTDQQKVENLYNAITDQREILKKYIDAPIDEIPQIFVPYKEALDVYELGLEVPEDVTLVWPDDNYGYIKRLSNPQEQSRKGKFGVYYHVSYCGTPHDYLWLNTTPPALMYEELSKAYRTGGDRYWLLNVGDIKPCELAIATFFDMAWEVGKFNAVNINEHQSDWLASIYGSQYRQDFMDILEAYYRLAWPRKPEYMGFEWQWDDPALKDNRDSDFSFQNYNDARNRLAEYDLIGRKTEKIMESLPAEYRSSFFEIFAYQVLASEQMDRKFLLAQLNHELAAQGNEQQAEWAAIESEKAYNAIEALNAHFNSLEGGKWDHFMSVPEGYVATYWKPAELTRFNVSPVPADIAPDPAQNVLEGCSVVDIRDYSIVNGKGCSISTVDGMGYEGSVVQIGLADEDEFDPRSAKSPAVCFKTGRIDSDKVTVHIYTLPTFPLYKGRSNEFGVSMDGSQTEVCENLPVEWSKPWKAQVMQNGHLDTLEFSIDPDADDHVLKISCGAPGIMVQRIVLDWGGLKETYVGPSIQ